MLKLYNTLSRKMEEFHPLEEGKVKLYGCGPTVYNYVHIGNLCAYTFEDIVIRTLRFLGYEVQSLMNITDIEDKTIRDSQAAHMTLKDFTELYTRHFHDDEKKLGLEGFDRYKPISELIPEMIDLIQKLLDAGHAYVSDDGSVYYDVKSFTNYGNLAHLDTKGMKAGARVKHDEYDKENLSDFALWKAYDPADGENYWNATFRVQRTKDKGQEEKTENTKQKTQRNLGAQESERRTNPAFCGTRNEEQITLKGRPGWHIECSACNLWGHGEQIDIHMGGCDLIFPHHQNEIAQTEGVTGKQFSKYWMHNGHLLVDNTKMSKSLGNFYRLQDLEVRYPHRGPLVHRGFRLMCLQNRYRENFNFTYDRLESAMATITNIDNFFKRIKNYTPTNTKVRREFRDKVQESMKHFIAHLEEDFDTVNALTIVFDCIGTINRDIDALALNEKEVSAVLELFKSWDSVLGVMDWSLLVDTEIPPEVNELLAERQKAKQEKNYALADEIRTNIDEMGYIIVDSKDGACVQKK